jgi:hypothetical protein
MLERRVIASPAPAAWRQASAPHSLDAQRHGSKQVWIRIAMTP